MNRSSKVFNSFLCIVGLSLIMVGWGGSWGSAYGQTAGPTPTAGVVAPITMLKTVLPANGVPNELLTFSIQVRNNDTVPHTNVVLTDRILDFLEIVSVSSTKGTASFSGQDVLVEIGTLDPGETVTVTIIVRIRPTTQSGSSGINVANVSADGAVAAISNPAAISVGQGAPIGLPDTGKTAQINPLMIGGGLLLLGLGVTLLFNKRQRVLK